jgi:hypothetical protein
LKPNAIAPPSDFQQLHCEPIAFGKGKIMEERELKALQIAAKSKLTRRGKTWLVPSQSVRGAPWNHTGTYPNNVSASLSPQTVSSVPLKP